MKIKKEPSAFPKRPLNPSASSFHIIVLELSQHKQEEDNEDNEDTEEDDEEDEEGDDYAVQNHKHAASFIIAAAAARLGC